MTRMAGLEPANGVFWSSFMVGRHTEISVLGTVQAESGRVDDLPQVVVDASVRKGRLAEALIFNRK